MMNIGSDSNDLLGFIENFSYDVKSDCRSTRIYLYIDEYVFAHSCLKML